MLLFLLQPLRLLAVWQSIQTAQRFGVSVVLRIWSLSLLEHVWFFATSTFCRLCCENHFFSASCLLFARVHITIDQNAFITGLAKPWYTCKRCMLGGTLPAAQTIQTKIELRIMLYRKYNSLVSPFPMQIPFQFQFFFRPCTARGHCLFFCYS